jgi:hypothetical protein
VFLKGVSSFERENQLVDFVYSLQLKEFDRNQDQSKTMSGLQLELQKSQADVSSLRLELHQNQQQIANFELELQKSQADMSSLRLELQKSQQEVSSLYSILSRMPLAAQEPTIEKTERSIQILNEYYGSKELPDVTLLFEKTSKINAHLVATNLYLKRGRYRTALSHLVRVGRMDPLILFSIQTLKIVANGLISRLSQA